MIFFFKIKKKIIQSFGAIFFFSGFNSVASAVLGYYQLQPSLPCDWIPLILGGITDRWQLEFIVNTLTMNKFVTIAKAAEILGVSATTLRRWEVAGKLVPTRTAGNQRRYSLQALDPSFTNSTKSNGVTYARVSGYDQKDNLARQVQVLDPNFANSIVSKGVTYAYARVSSHDQEDDLARQVQVLEMYCAARVWKFEVITDLGSGINYHKKGLKKLLAEIIAGRVERLVIVHKDCLLRFGAELIFSICECKNVEVVIMNKGQDPTFEEDLTKDILEIITVFSARLYGSRSNKNRELIVAVQKAVEETK